MTGHLPDGMAIIWVWPAFQTRAYILKHIPTSNILKVGDLTYLLTNSIVQIFLEKLIGFELVKKFLAFYGNRRFITAEHFIIQLMHNI